MFKIVIVRMHGGLGNQLFLAAYGLKLSNEMGLKYFYVDTSTYKNKPGLRKYSLEEYGIDQMRDIAEWRWYKLYKFCYDPLIFAFRSFAYIKRKLSKVRNLGQNQFTLLSFFGLFFCIDNKLRFRSKFNLIPVCVVFGYFQSASFFCGSEEFVKKNFFYKKTMNNREKEIYELMRKSESVAVSIRAGVDYLSSKHLNVCDQEYIQNAIKLLKGRSSNCKFFIFSDEINLVKKEYNLEPDVIYINGFDDKESLRLMSSCKHFIITNSSFSWWGAFLGTNKDKVIVSPSRWTNEKGAEDDDIFHKGMTIIKV